MKGGGALRPRFFGRNSAGRRFPKWFRVCYDSVGGPGWEIDYG
jgi:hypothetical protein